MGNDSDKIVRQIRAILAKAADGSGATEAEAESALRFARRLMLAHNFTEGDLAQRDPSAIAADAERTAMSQETAWADGERHSRWEGWLGLAIARLYGTLGVYNGHAQERKSPSGAMLFGDNGESMRCARFVFYGPEEDARDAVELFDEWRLTIASLARLTFGGVYRGPGRSYAEGFATALLNATKKIEDEERAQLTQPASTSTALVALGNARALMDAKKQKAAHWLRHSEGVRLGSAGRSGGGHHHGDAYSRGKAAGSQAQLARKERTRRLGQ